MRNEASGESRRQAAPAAANDLAPSDTPGEITALLPTKQLAPIFVFPAKLLPGQKTAFSSTTQSCPAMIWFISRQSLPMRARAPTQQKGPMTQPSAMVALLEIFARSDISGTQGCNKNCMASDRIRVR